MNMPLQITQKNLDDFKSLYPEDPRIRALTLSEVLENTRGRSVDWSSLRFEAPPEPAAPGAQISITPCQSAVGFVIFDAVCFGMGAIGLPGSAERVSIDGIVAAAEPVIVQITNTLRTVGNSTTDYAWAVFNMLQTIWTGGCLGGIIAAITQGLTWWDAVLYGITGVATIVAAVATDGTAFAAEVIILLATCAWFHSDLAKMRTACFGLSDPAPAPAWGPFPNGAAINPSDATPAAPAPSAFSNKLYVFWKANDSSNAIFYSASADGASWPPGQRINTVDSTPAAPASCVLGNKLYVFWQANDSSNAILYSASTDGASWPAGQRINTVDSTPAALAACVLGDKLYLFWQANDSSNAIYYSASTDGASWPAGQRINTVDSTPAALAACVLAGKLYLFWPTNDSSNAIYYSASTDGASWPAGQRVNTVDSTPAALAACVNDDNIHLFWKANDSTNAIFYGTLANGSRWLGSQTINGVDTTPDTPAACMFNERLYLFWRANDSSNAIFNSASDLPGANPFPFEPVAAVKTSTGNFLTVVNNGGLGGGNVAIHTDSRTVGPWEKFTIVPIDQQQRTFALRTCNGQYVTAVNGGGIGGPNDASCPIHTDATARGGWENLIFEQQADGTYAIATTDGFYLTAVNGGGVGGPNDTPIHTDATALGAWEVFTLVINAPG